MMRIVAIGLALGWLMTGCEAQGTASSAGSGTGESDVEGSAEPDPGSTPDTEEDVEQPDTEEDVEQPDTQEDVEQPDTEEDVEQPDTQEDVEQPDTEEDVEQPDTQEDVEQPDTEEDVETPSKNLHWYSSCGDPVCSPNSKPPDGTPECTTEKQGDPCDTELETCDAGLGCGAVLICAESDPKLQPSGCPISLRDAKTDIGYLTPEQLEQLHRLVLSTKLATWRYKGQTDDGKRLGFIIDDAPGSPAVAGRGDRVDVYALASMAIGALQVQARRIEALEKACGLTPPAR